MLQNLCDRVADSTWTISLPFSRYSFTFFRANSCNLAVVTISVIATRRLTFILPLTSSIAAKNIKKWTLSIIRKYSEIFVFDIRIYSNIRTTEYSVNRIFGWTEYSNIRFKRIFGNRIFGCPNIRFNRILKYSVWPNIRLNRILEYSNHRIFGYRIFDSFEYRISNIKCRIRISTELFDIPNCGQNLGKTSAHGYYWRFYESR